MFKRHILSATNLGGLLASSLLGLGYLLIIFPVSFLWGEGPFWQNQTTDIAQYLAGFWAFFSTPWNFPLLQIPSINYPMGANGLFLDIVPFFSLLIKALLPSTLFPFNPFGAYIALCVGLQACASWYLLRTLKLESWPGLVALTICLLIFPPWAHRINHIGLYSHWQLLLALSLYFQSSQKWPTGKWSLLLVITLHTHLYLLAMILIIYATSVLKTGFHYGREKILPPLVMIASGFLTFLPISVGKISKEWGFGEYSMNLLAPLTGSSLLPWQINFMPNQYEGMNYLGGGIILLAIYSIYVCQRQDPLFWQRHRSLLGGLGILAIYALSNKIYWGTYLLGEIPLPKILEPLASQFRSSGRFFWPVGHAITIFSIITIVKWQSQRSRSILAFIIIVQILDTLKFQQNLATKVQQPSPPIIDHEIWERELGQKVTHLYFFPKYRCGRNSVVEQTLLPLMNFAMKTGRTINTGVVARSSPDCSSINDELQAASWPTSVFLFSMADFPSKELLEILLAASGNFDCHEFQFTFLCRGTLPSGPPRPIITKTVTIKNPPFFTAASAIFGNKSVTTNGQGGFLIYGPYQALPKGSYQVKIFGQGSAVNGSILQVVSENGNFSHGEGHLQTPLTRQGPLAQINFVLEKFTPQIEFRLAVHQAHSFTISHLELSFLAY